MQKYGQTQFEAVQIYRDSERVIHDISKTNDEMIGREGYSALQNHLSENTKNINLQQNRSWKLYNVLSLQTILQLNIITYSILLKKILVNTSVTAT